MPRLAFICHASLGGSARVALDLAFELAKRGHSVDLFCRTPPVLRGRLSASVRLHCLRPVAATSDDPGFLHTRWRDLELAAFSEMIRQQLRRRPVDILHFHYALPFAQLALQLRGTLGTAAPIVIGTLHGTDVLLCKQSPREARSVGDALRGGADALTAVSHSLAGLARDHLPAAPQPMVIPNFIDLRGAPDRPRGRRPERQIIAHVSNFREVKRPLDVARIFARLSPRLDAELWLIGTGPLLGATLRELHAQGLSSRVRAFGLRHDVRDLLHHCDLLLLTSDYESFSMTALEALAAGTPVVAPHVGGLPEVVDDGRSGVLYAPRDLCGATTHIEELLTDPDRLQRFREAALRSALVFSADRIVPSYTKFYADCLRGSELARNREALPS